MVKLFLLVFFISFSFAKEIVVYVNSHIDKQTTIERWQPTIDLLNKKIPEYRFKLLPIPPTNVNEIKKLLDEQKIDLLITQPAITNILIHSHSISPILTVANKYQMSKFGSVFITQKENDINTISDIKGKTIAAVAPMGFGGWLIGYNELMDHDIDPEKDGLVTFVGSQHGVVSLINEGSFEVGIIRTGILENLLEKSLTDISNIKVINDNGICIKNYNIYCSTKLFPEWSLSKTSHLDIHLANRIFKVFNSIKHTDIEAIRGEYYHWHLPEGFKEVDDLFKKFYLAHYADIKSINQKETLKILLIAVILISIIAIIVVFIIRYRLLKSNEQRVLETLDKEEDIANIGHWELDFNTKEIIWSNQMLKILGFNKRPKKIGPELLKTLMNKDDYLILVNSLNKANKDHSYTHNILCRIIKHDTKKMIWANCRGSFNEKIQKFEGTFQDVTEFKNTKDELDKKKEILVEQSKSAMMGEMISMIVHQFKQPLSILSMIASNQKLSVGLGEKIENDQILKDATMVDNQVVYLSNTMDTFKNFLKPDNEKVNEKVDVVIENALTIINKSLVNNNIELIKEYKSDQHIEIIHSEFMQVFINLLNNSKDAFKINNIKNRKIWISTYDDNKSVIIEVEDTAGSIPVDKLDSIFDAYFTTKKDNGGTGIGLYIVKAIIVEHLNGVIDVQNTEKGVKFTIIIPSFL